LKLIKLIILVIFTTMAFSLMGNIAFADIKWGLDGGVSTGYDDNVTYANTNRISSMVTHTSIDGGFTQEGKNEQFEIKAGLTENIYTSHSSLNNLAENLSAGFTGDLNPYDHIKASEVFSHSVDPSSLENAFGRINGSYGTYYNKLDLGYSHDFTDQWSSFIHYKQTNFVFTPQSLSDSAGYNPGISMKYVLSPMAQATLNYDYRRRTFSPGGNSDANSPTVGWRQYITTQWYVDLLGGADFIKGFGQNLVEPRYAVGLTHELDMNTKFSLRYEKQYETDPYTQDIDNDWRLVLNAFHQFTSRIDGNIDLFSGQGKFVITGISYKFIGTNVVIKYALNDHLDVSLTYGITDSISKSTVRNSIHNTVFLGITYKY
jgi:hypothetical protein